MSDPCGDRSGGNLTHVGGEQSLPRGVFARRSASSAATVIPAPYPALSGSETTSLNAGYVLEMHRPPPQVARASFEGSTYAAHVASSVHVLNGTFDAGGGSTGPHA